MRLFQFGPLHSEKPGLVAPCATSDRIFPIRKVVSYLSEFMVMPGNRLGTQTQRVL